MYLTLSNYSVMPSIDFGWPKNMAFGSVKECSSIESINSSMSNNIFSFATFVANRYARSPHFEDRDRTVSRLKTV